MKTSTSFEQLFPLQKNDSFHILNKVRESYKLLENTLYPNISKRRNHYSLERYNTTPSSFLSINSDILDSNQKIMGENEQITNRIHNLERDSNLHKFLNNKLNKLISITEMTKDQIFDFHKQNNNLLTQSDQLKKYNDQKNFENNRIENYIKLLKDKTHNLQILNRELQGNYNNIEYKFDFERKKLEEKIEELNKNYLKMKKDEVSLIEKGRKLNKNRGENEQIVKNMRVSINQQEQKNRHIYILETEKKIDENEHNAKKVIYIKELINNNNELTRERDKIDKKIKSVNDASNHTNEFNLIKGNINELLENINSLNRDIVKKDQLIDSIKEKYSAINKKLSGVKLRSTQRKTKEISEMLNQTMFIKYIKEKERNTMLIEETLKLKRFTRELSDSLNLIGKAYEREIEKMKKEIALVRDSSKQKVGNENDYEMKDLLEENKKLKEEFNILSHKIRNFSEFKKGLQSLRDKNIFLHKSNLEIANELKLNDNI